MWDAAANSVARRHWTEEQAAAYERVLAELRQVSPQHDWPVAIADRAQTVWQRHPDHLETDQVQALLEQLVGVRHTLAERAAAAAAGAS